MSDSHQNINNKTRVKREKEDGLANRTGRGKRKQFPSEEESTNTSDSSNMNTTKYRGVGGPAGGRGERMAINNSTPKRTSLTNKQQEEKENEINCCRFCNDHSWESRIYYKCGTVLSKYFPKTNNNPNPGWYKGTIRMHRVEADTTVNIKKEYSERIWNEIHYEDGDMENITQAELNYQLMDGQVKILQSTRTEISSNAALCCNPVVPTSTTTTLSDYKFDQKWLENYQRLQKFKAENGHCRVPQRHGHDSLLGKWVTAQRQVYKKGKIARDRVDKLEEIGFDWDPGSTTSDQQWDQMFGRLEQFKADNGHCRVPCQCGPDPSLGVWVSTQRQHYKKGKMAADRKDKLNKLGFQWDARAETWVEMLGRLEQFKAENGHCRVPNKYGPDASLGLWVSKQRQQYKRGILAPDREQKLEKIDFEWAPISKYY